MDINAIMKQAQEMQAKMQEVQENLANTEIEGESGGGLVKITLTGKGLVTSVKVSEELLKVEEKEVLEDLIAAAFNDTKNKIEDQFGSEMGNVAKDMGLPADFKMPI